MFPERNKSDFIAHMEDVLDVYHRLYDSRFPVICMDEANKQCIKETRKILPPAPGYPARHDYEYERNGSVNIFIGCEPLVGKRFTQVTDRRTKNDWAFFITSQRP